MRCPALAPEIKLLGWRRIGGFVGTEFTVFGGRIFRGFLVQAFLQLKLFDWRLGRGFCGWVQFRPLDWGLEVGDNEGGFDLVLFHNSGH